MMKRTMAFCLALILLLLVSACGSFTSTTVTNKPENSQTPTTNAKPSHNIILPTASVVPTAPSSQTTEPTTPSNPSVKDTKVILDEYQLMVTENIKLTISELTETWSQLQTDITTYEAYVANLDRIEAFYCSVEDTTLQLTHKMYDYTLMYAEVIVSTDDKYGDKYDYLEEIYDVIYDNAGDEVYDEIYDDLLDDIYDCFYDGILKDAYDTVPYDEWSGYRSNEYNIWSDTHSYVYRICSDSRSDIYDFYGDIRSAIYQKNEPKANERIQKFKKRIARVKGLSDLAYTSHPELASVNTIEALSTLIEKDAQSIVAALDNEWQTLRQEIDTYQKYVERADEIEAFYETLYNTSNALLLRYYEYTLVYARIVMESDMSAKEKYQEVEGIYEIIYEDAFDMIYDSIYDDLLEDMNDMFYDGIIEDAEDDVPYAEWVDVRSEEYSLWLNTRSDIYRNWLDAHSDIYGFYLQIRGELLAKDMEGANKYLLSFEKRFLRLTGQEID